MRHFLHRATIHKRSNYINTLEQVGGKQVSIIQKGFKALENFYRALHEIAKLFVSLSWADDARRPGIVHGNRPERGVSVRDNFERLRIFHKKNL